MNIIKGSKLGKDIDTDSEMALAIGSAMLLLLNKPDSIGQGTWTPITHTTQYLQFMQDSGAGASDGDNATWNIYLQKGTYTVRVYYQEQNGGGIMDITLGGETVVTGLDTQAGSSTYNNEQETTGISIATSGLKAFVVTCNGKSGAGYRLKFSHAEIRRTA